MSVLLETSLGDLVIDLEVDSCPKTCENFLKLCKVYYYNLNAFFNGAYMLEKIRDLSLFYCPVSKDFLAQVGDPTATGTGGESIWSLLSKDSVISSPRYFPPEVNPKLKHTHKGTVSMAVAPSIDGGAGGCGSQFFITLADNIEYLDGKHAVFGHVVEGLETLEKLNEIFTDQEGRPFKDVRIRHVVVLGTINVSPVQYILITTQMIRFLTQPGSSSLRRRLHAHQTTPRASLKMKIRFSLCLRKKKSASAGKRPPPHQP
jgi:peptidyl-prolyl cis-trans isomerase-like 4